MCCRCHLTFWKNFSPGSPLLWEGSEAACFDLLCKCDVPVYPSQLPFHGLNFCTNRGFLSYSNSFTSFVSATILTTPCCGGKFIKTDLNCYLIIQNSWIPHPPQKTDFLKITIIGRTSDPGNKCDILNKQTNQKVTIKGLMEPIFISLSSTLGLFAQTHFCVWSLS